MKRKMWQAKKEEGEEKTNKKNCSKIFYTRVSQTFLFIEHLPCFPKNKTGLILILTLKYDTIGLVFEGCLLFSSISKQSY